VKAQREQADKLEKHIAYWKCYTRSNKDGPIITAVYTKTLVTETRRWYPGYSVFKNSRSYTGCPRSPREKLTRISFVQFKQLKRSFY